MTRLVVGTILAVGVLVVALGLWRGATDAPSPVAGGSDAVAVRTAEVRELEAAGPSVTGTVEDGVVVPVLAPRRAAVAAIEVEAGERVAAGDVVVRFEQTTEQATLMSAEAEVAQAEAEYDWARDQAEAEALAGSAGASERRLEELQAQLERARERLEAARAALAAQNVEAPVAGRVESVTVEVGELVQAGARLAELRADELTAIRFTVPRAFTTTLAVGDRVEIATDDGVVEARDLVLEGGGAGLGRDLDILAQPVPDADALAPGTEVAVRLPGGEATWLSVPRDAILDDEAGARVFRIDRGLAWSLPVETAPEAQTEPRDDAAGEQADEQADGEQADSGRVAVRGAIQPGEQVAVTELARLADGTPVTVVDDDDR